MLLTSLSLRFGAFTSPTTFKLGSEKVSGTPAGTRTFHLRPRGEAARASDPLCALPRLIHYVHADEPPLQYSQPRLAQAVEENGNEDDAREHHWLQLEVDLHENHAGLHHLHQHGPENGAESTADSAEKARASEHRSGDDVELLADPKRLV